MLFRSDDRMDDGDSVRGPGRSLGGKMDRDGLAQVAAQDKGADGRKVHHAGTGEDDDRADSRGAASKESADREGRQERVEERQEFAGRAVEDFADLGEVFAAGQGRQRFFQEIEGQDVCFSSDGQG